MNKIPVGATVTAAYRFTFGNMGTVIGLIWLPLLVYTLSRFFVVDYYAMHLAQSGDPSAGGRATLILFGFWFVSLFFTAIIGVSLTHQALAPRAGSIIVHFAVGPTEFNYFFSLLAIFLVMLAVYAAAMIADLGIGALAGVIAGSSFTGRSALLAGIAIAILALDFAILIYVAIRLVFLVAPVTVSEGKIDLTGAWKLSRGNFWRMFAVLAATFVPAMLIGEVVFATVVGPAYFAALAAAFFSVFRTVLAGGNAPVQALQNLPDITSKTPLLLGASFLLAPFTYGLTFAPAAFAYRALVGDMKQPPSTEVGPFKAA